jgi:hypothetical protein
MGPNRVDISSSPHLRMETDPLSETFCFLVSRIPHDGQNPNTKYKVKKTKDIPVTGSGGP